MHALLADFPIAYTPFDGIELTFSAFSKSSFQALSQRKKFTQINEALLKHIQQADEPCFLLAAVLEFISRVNDEKLLEEPYRMLNFEFWLNHFSDLKPDENSTVRQKIAGKKIPRDEYQAFFPIGTGKSFQGSHFVAAHLAPDVDTTIASFWGWLDAFSARVGTSLHQWSLPGPFQDAHIKLLFQELFSKNVFEMTVRQTQVLSLTALDLVSQKDIVKVSNRAKSASIDHSMLSKPIIVIDELGHFQGDWRASDAEAVRQVVVVFYSLIGSFESAIYETIISSLAKKQVDQKTVTTALASLLATQIKTWPTVKEYSERQKKQLHDFLKKVLGLSKGNQSLFSDLIEKLSCLVQVPFSPLELLEKADLYDTKGALTEDRPKIFSHLESVFKEVDCFLEAVRSYVDRLDILLCIKDKVLQIPAAFITPKSEVGEIRKKMENFNQFPALDHLPVLVEESGKWFVVGVVYASDVKQTILGSVSLRDFSNQQETKMASYLQVISIIDHHKSDITTSGVCTLVVSDAQSSNTILADLWMEINDRYSLCGQSRESISSQLQNQIHSDLTGATLPQISRLLQLKQNSQKSSEYYIDPRREFAEYLCFLHAILDDTDLLTKVTLQDVVCVSRLLNRMKSIASKKECSCIELSEIKGSDFIAQARSIILQNEDMYSLYSKIYAYKEKEVTKELVAFVEGRPSSLLSDTKEQNGCVRVGQLKLFATNVPFFLSHEDTVRTLWLQEAEKIYEMRPQFDLHLQMISTIAGADEVKDAALDAAQPPQHWAHKDELWFWIPETSLAAEHLIHFLNAFHATKIVQSNAMEVSFLGPNCQELQNIFSQNFPKAIRKNAPKELSGNYSLAILRFKAGLLNSRKALISPYLPRSIA